MRGGGSAAAGDSGAPYYFKVIGETAKMSHGELYAFGQTPDKYLKKREAEPEKLEGEPAAELPLPPPLIMGDWERVAVPPAEMKKKQFRGAEVLGLKPKLSALKVVYERRKARAGVPVGEYPSDAKLLEMVVGFHDLKSVVSLVHNVFKKEEKEAARKAAK
eukprot:2613782-Prymnesium_polylepis.1